MAVAHVTSFGGLMRRYRTSAGLSQEGLAERADMSARAISDLERGVHRAPYPDTLDRIADALELSETERRELEESSERHRSRHFDTKDARSIGDAIPLISTKLTRPTLRPSVVPRPRLIDRLRRGACSKLILISAPAGFGKTTLLSAWSAHLPGSEMPLAWVSIDEGDNDLLSFWSYVIAALDELDEGVGATAMGLLRVSPAPAVETVLTVLMNGLMTLSQEVWLVLDDYHLIENGAIHRGITFLLDHLPPRLHLILSVRDDPPLALGRMRASGDMTELRAADLRFTPEEAAAFLNTVMELRLSPEEVATLETRTEGWIAGLQLAALAMGDRSDIQGFISAFAGSNRYVADYLTEEVLARQPDPAQTFLVQTSILDRLCAPLCAAVLCSSDDENSASAPECQRMLESLEHGNAFVSALDDDRQWFRYHHLFAEMLRHRLHADQASVVAELHRRAARWFEGRNSIPEAVHHALAAGDGEGAATLVERHAHAMIDRGEIAAPLRWLESLPEKQVRSRPRLNLTLAWGLFLTRQLPASEARVRATESALSITGTGEVSLDLLGEIATMKSHFALMAGSNEEAVRLCLEALEQLPHDDRMRGRVLVSLASALQARGDDEEAAEAFRKAYEINLAQGDTLIALIALRNLAETQIAKGRLHHAATLYERSLQDAGTGEGELSALRTIGLLGLAGLHLEWNDLDRADEELDEAIKIAGRSSQLHRGIEATVARSFVLQTRGHHGDAAALMHSAQHTAHLLDDARFLLTAEADLARFRLAQGDLEAAERWAETSGLTADDDMAKLGEREWLTLVQVRLAVSRTQSDVRALHDALALLDRLQGAAETAGRTGSLIKILTLRSLALQVQGNADGATRALERALVLAEPEGYVRTFVNEGAPLYALLTHLRSTSQGTIPPRLAAYIGRLLTALGSRDVNASDTPGVDTTRVPLDPLTERELDVLRLIVAGLANRTIANELYVTVNTVKWYIKSIYSKLDAQNRSQAIARAHALNLLPR